MPIYEYHCEDCDGEVDIFFLSISDVEQTAPECPECGGKKLNRIMSKVAVNRGKGPARGNETKNPRATAEDPKALADAMGKAEAGSKSGFGEDFREVKGRLEKGESSTSIEKKLRKRVGETMDTH